MLWWVRVELHWPSEIDPTVVKRPAGRLFDRFPQYEGRPFAWVSTFLVVGLTGWAASADG